METQNPGCVAYCGSRKSGPIGGLGSKISVGCGGRNATAVHQGGAVFFWNSPNHTPLCNSNFVWLFDSHAE